MSFAPTPQQMKQFKEEGYYISAPAFDAKMLAEVTKEFDRLHREVVEKAAATGEEKRIRLARLRPFIGEAHLKSDVLKEVVKAPVYTEACKALLGPDADLYYNQVVIKPPEQGMPFGWHQDTAYGPCEPMEYLTCWTAIGRAFVENGCVWIIPGSHKRGLLKHVRSEYSLDAVLEDEQGAIPVELEPGQVVIFNSLLLHKSGPNVSSEVRRAYVPQYHVSNVIEKATGQPHGDRFPVLRAGLRAA
ncbi:MAG: phytanoyl-CoA dioxygenase family protein [Planctomycetota bacterium]|nr:phytanoyl-CoA dioxygenase family protein [Planctomycetota bacterium]